MLIDAFSAALVGLISAGHCMGMCGGVTMALGLHSRGTGVLLAYNLGRVTTYGLLGLLVGAGLAWLPVGFMPVLRLIAALLLIMVALYYLNLGAWITRVERLGLPLWRRLQPLARRWLPVQSPSKAYRVGMVWGLLPCGLVYTALGYAATQADAVRSLLMMLAFGLGTLPAMLATGVFSQQINGMLKQPLTRALIGILLFAFAGWLAVESIQMLKR